jgi:hypothetical protein
LPARWSAPSSLRTQSVSVFLDLTGGAFLRLKDGGYVLDKHFLPAGQPLMIRLVCFKRLKGSIVMALSLVDGTRDVIPFVLAFSRDFCGA